MQPPLCSFPKWGFGNARWMGKLCFAVGRLANVCTNRHPPAKRKSEDARWIDIHESEFDEAQMAMGVKQAAALPGWIP